MTCTFGDALGCGAMIEMYGRFDEVDMWLDMRRNGVGFAALAQLSKAEL